MKHRKEFKTKKEYMRLCYEFENAYEALHAFIETIKEVEIGQYRPDFEFSTREKLLCHQC